MKRVYNFSAGPAGLPQEVLEQAQNELLDWHGRGMSVMEMSHRSEDFINIAAEAEADFRELLNISDDYHVLFLQTGGRGQFSMIPLNLLHDKKTADYLDTGIWSYMAIQEAKRYCDVNVVASSRESNYVTVPDFQQWQRNKDAAYLLYVDNETVNGVELPYVPDIGDVTLVSDMSSNILSRELDVNKFGLIFAGAQKNIGPSGLTIVIVHDDLIGKSLPFTPTILDYQAHVKQRSMYYTPPTFAWYLAGLVFKWVKRQGGVAAMDKLNKAKSKKLYDYIDQSDFYYNQVKPNYRSRMNVVFKLTDASLDKDFLKQAELAELSSLKGHRLVGGMRASIYNPMPEAGVDRLINFMREFERTKG